MSASVKEPLSDLSKTPLQQSIHFVPAVEPSLLGEQLLSVFNQHKSKSLVVADGASPIGFLSHRKVTDLMSTQFGYAVYQKRSVTALMTKEFLSVEAHCPMTEVVERALEREQDMLYEDIVVVKDGKYLGLLSIAQVLSDQRRKITEQLHSLEDKGDQLEKVNIDLRDAMARLGESEGRLSAMFKASRDAIGVSKNGVHIFANPAYLKLFGIESDEKIVGTPILDSIAPSYRLQITENIRRRYLGEEIPQIYEARGLKANGTEFDAGFNVSTYELNGENYSLAVIRDITLIAEVQ